MDTKLIVRYAIRETMGLVIMGIALFWSAGQINWWPAWASLAVMFIWTVATAVVIVRSNPALLVERLGPRKGAKAWIQCFEPAWSCSVRYVTAGLISGMAGQADFLSLLNSPRWLHVFWAMRWLSGQRHPMRSSRRLFAYKLSVVTW
jgi:hypothetical protein